MDGLNELMQKGKYLIDTLILMFQSYLQNMNIPDTDESFEKLHFYIIAHLTQPICTIIALKDFSQRMIQT